MAGYSGKPLVQKLGLKPGHRIALAGAPTGFLAELAPLPQNVRVLQRAGSALDCVVLFASAAGPLEAQVGRWAARLAPAGMLWFAWPKRASKVATDVTEALVRQTGLGAGLVDIKICAVNEVWSGLKFVRRLRDRGPQGLVIGPIGLPASDAAMSAASRRCRVASCCALITKKAASRRYPGGRAEKYFHAAGDRLNNARSLSRSLAVSRCS